MTEWDSFFERARMDQQMANSLEFQHLLVRETRSGDYFYGSSRRRMGYRLRRLFTRRLAYGIEVICPGSADDLSRATYEVAQLVAKANACYMQAADLHRETSLAARVATDRLAAAMLSAEKQIKKQGSATSAHANRRIDVMTYGTK